MVFTPATFWGNLTSSNQGSTRAQRGASYMQGKVLKVGLRTSRLLEETSGCSHSQSLGVFCFLLLCHRDLAAHVVFAQRLAQWPEAGTVKHKQQTVKTLPGSALAITQQCRELRWLRGHEDAGIWGSVRTYWWDQLQAAVASFTHFRRWGTRCRGQF